MAYGSSGVDHWTAHRPVFLRLPVLEPKSLLYRHGAFYTLRHRHFITFIYHVQYVYILFFIIFFIRPSPNLRSKSVEPESESVRRTQHSGHRAKQRTLTQVYALFLKPSLDEKLFSFSFCLPPGAWLHARLPGLVASGHPRDLWPLAIKVKSHANALPGKFDTFATIAKLHLKLGISQPSVSACPVCLLLTWSYISLDSRASSAYQKSGGKAHAILGATCNCICLSANCNAPKLHRIPSSARQSLWLYLSAPV